MADSLSRGAEPAPSLPVIDPPIPLSLAAKAEAVTAGALQAEIDRLRQGLWDCAIAAGMDHDGDLTPAALAAPDIVEVALREVRELRNDYDEELGGGRA